MSLMLKSTFITGIFTAALSLAFTGCSGQNNADESGAENQKETVKSEKSTEKAIVDIGPKEFQEKIKKDKVQLVDVRTKMETDKGVIANPVLNDFYSDDFKENLKSLNKDEPVYVYCHSGGRSLKAANMMKEMGFKKVYNLENGFSSWKKQDLPISEPS
ncbi:rhodanese-like domain-containing protein [Salibacter halophilus]|nr:rhodanese-like domain-containing protein [Salibacter halophilus]